MPRDDFPQWVKDALDARAGHCCSFPGCGISTSGPSSESESAVANTGTAAHISGAAPGKGSRRYDASLTSEERKSIENGIWCCRLHGTLIDTDEVTYTIAMLKQWRAIAETTARIRQQYGLVNACDFPEMQSLALAPQVLHLEAMFTNDVVGESVTLSCVNEIWGHRIASSSRDFLIEYARNAFEHGGASEVSLEFKGNAIVVTDNGRHFDPRQLAPENVGRGGGFAYRRLVKYLSVGAIAARIHDSGTNQMIIPLVRDLNDLITHNPCALSVTRDQLKSGTIDFRAVQECDTVYVVAPRYQTYSDRARYELLLGNAAQIPSQLPANVVLILPYASEDVVQYFRSRFPDTPILAWPS
jgi:hypothetical protein